MTSRDVIQFVDDTVESSRTITSQVSHCTPDNIYAIFVDIMDVERSAVAKLALMVIGNGPVRQLVTSY